ncbi:hypothetical protein LTR09_006833 [Extremus antarcticus]|uniref:Uncharacterized protein n=1 Tax=Extremus antarcticus TaxID=702011 RepID=A0AAJ0DDA6_9PEZI|nr:hypothetical protein LTR09_006833 [Extremus antarcticus]
MPRVLPWEVDEEDKKLKQKKPRSSPAPKRNPIVNQEEDEDLVDSDLNPIHTPPPPEKRPKKQRNRSPSTSPPPAAPATVYMREGYQADDIWRMVEDEFYSTAQTFTQHIHRAEYLRLRRLAKSRGAATLKSVARATDGKTAQSGEMKLKLEVEDMAKKRKAAMKDSDDENSSEEEDDFMQDPQLAVLMTGVQGQGAGKNLLRKHQSKANTRAAAGFLQSPENVERTRDMVGNATSVRSTAISDDVGPGGTRKAQPPEPDSEEDGDLDAPPARTVRPSYAKAEKRRVESTAGDSSPQPKSNGVAREKGRSIFAQFAKPSSDTTRNTISTFTVSPERAPTTTKPAKKSAPPASSNSGDQSTKNATSDDSAAREWRAKYKADKERKEREAKRKAKAADEIPTFHF